MKRFLLDNDGNNFFKGLGHDVVAAVAEAASECHPAVTTYLVCSGAGTCYWPTRVGTVDPRADGLLAARPCHWLEGLDRPETASAKPLLLSVNHRRSREEGVDAPASIPAPIVSGEALDVTVRVPRAALPCWRAMCLVDSGGDVSSAVNSADATAY